MSGIEERIEMVIATHRPQRHRGDIETCQRGCKYEKGAWYAHLAAVLVAELGLTQEDQAAAVFVEDIPRRMVQRGLEECPAIHVEFIPHTRLTTPWHGPECPDCAAEPGIHDRRHAEIIAQTWRDAVETGGTLTRKGIAT